MPVLSDENNLTEPEPRPELASRPGRWGSIAPISKTGGSSKRRKTKL
jgi:hypothetical protein